MTKASASAGAFVLYVVVPITNTRGIKMAMTFALKMGVEDANHVKALLEEDIKQQEAWILAKATNEDEKNEAKRRLSISDRLLREFR